MASPISLGNVRQLGGGKFLIYPFVERQVLIAESTFEAIGCSDVVIIEVIEVGTSVLTLRKREKTDTDSTALTTVLSTT